MHNSHNSVPSKDSYRSASLAQAKLLGSSDITEVPTFHNPVITLPEVTDEMRATLSRLSANASKRALLAEHAKSVFNEVDAVEDTEDEVAEDDLRIMRIDYFNSLGLEV